MKKKLTRKEIEKCLQILANNLTVEDYTKVTSLMAMLFVGHKFELSDDGFEFINLAIKTKKQEKTKKFHITRQDNVIKIKPN